MDRLDELTEAMIAFDAGDPRRIQHFLKVHAFARLIGRLEGLDADTQLILEAAALTHDIGIRPAEEKYGRCNGALQERLGPAYAREMLNTIGFDTGVTERVCTLVGRHHTYTGVDGADCRILIEADFLVNLHEDDAGKDAMCAAKEQVFRTKTGTELLVTMFGV